MKKSMALFFKCALVMKDCCNGAQIYDKVTGDCTHNDSSDGCLCPASSLNVVEGWLIALDTKSLKRKMTKFNLDHGPSGTSCDRTDKNGSSHDKPGAFLRLAPDTAICDEHFGRLVVVCKKCEHRMVTV